MVPDRLDAPIGRWFKRGLSRRQPPAHMRSQILRTAAAWTSVREQRQARATPQWVGRKPRDWHLGVARQTAMDQFPLELAPLRLAY